MGTRIGIDLDHTILRHENGESEILFGFKAFVMEQRRHDRQITVLCYTENQTEEKIRAALVGHRFFESMDDGGFGFSENDLVFVDSNEGMIARINALKITHFIDTQAGFVLRDDFPESVQPLLLEKGLDEVPGFSDWSTLTDYFTWGQGLTSRLNRVETLRDYGENHVYKVHTADGRAMVLKRHMDQESGAGQEVETLTVLRKVGIDCIPEPQWNQDGWTLSGWVEGQAVSEPGSDQVQQIIDFLVKLHQSSADLRNENLADAANARLSFQSYVDAVNKIWKEVLSACQRPDGPKDALLFLMTDMEQMRQDNQNHLFLWCKRQGWEKEAAFPREQLMLCPADFGLHNALDTGGGKLAFLDFEGSGWDDPAHLMANFFHNPENNLSQDQKLEVLNGFVERIDDGEAFMNRFWAVADVVAAEWIFKTLYVIVPEEMRRQVYLNPGLDPKQLVKDRFKQALQMHESFKPMEHLCKHDQLLDSDDIS